MAPRSFVPKRATRKGQLIRLAVDGPTGSGKTWTSLELAREIVGPNGSVLLIDTERGSSGLYSDTFTFDVVEFDTPYDPTDLRACIIELAPDYDAIIVDSLTHFWTGEGGTLDIVDKASRKAKGNKFVAWAKEPQSSATWSTHYSKHRATSSQRCARKWST